MASKAAPAAGGPAAGESVIAYPPTLAAFKAAYTAACGAAGITPRDVVLQTVAVAAAARVDVVEELNLAGNSRVMFNSRLTDAEVGALAEAVLSSRLVIGSLILSYNVLSDAGAIAVARMLQDGAGYTCGIKVLDLRSNAIGAMGAKALAKALTANASVFNLCLNGNSIGNEGGMAIAELLYHNLFLQTVDIGSCEIGEETLIALATVLNTNTTLFELNVENPRIKGTQEDTTYRFARMLQVNRTLQVLRLGKHDMKDFGAALLAEYLVGNHALRILDLRCNRIAGAGTTALANLIKGGHPLEELNLDANRITNEGALPLAAALKANTTLKRLYLRNTGMKDEGLAAVAAMLQDNRTLTHIRLWGNEFGDASKRAFHALFNGRLKYMPISIDFSSYITDNQVHLALEDAASS